MGTDFVEKFKRHLKEDGKSPKTVESYVGDVGMNVEHPDTKAFDTPT
jgi:hypothetical protein